MILAINQGPSSRAGKLCARERHCPAGDDNYVGGKSRTCVKDSTKIRSTAPLHPFALTCPQLLTSKYCSCGATGTQSPGPDMRQCTWAHKSMNATMGIPWLAQRAPLFHTFSLGNHDIRASPTSPSIRTAQLTPAGNLISPITVRGVNNATLALCLMPVPKSEFGRAHYYDVRMDSQYDLDCIF